jgi:hypothetical protein
VAVAETTTQTPTKPARKPRTKKVVTPTIKEVTVSHSLSIKVQVEKFTEYAEFGLSESRTFDVSGLDDAGVTEFVEGVRTEIAERLAQDAVTRADMAVEERTY